MTGKTTPKSHLYFKTGTTNSDILKSPVNKYTKKGQVTFMKSKTCILLTLSSLVLAGSMAGQKAMARTYARTDRNGSVTMISEEAATGFVATVQDETCEASVTADIAAAALQEETCEASVAADIAAAAETVSDETSDRAAFRKICKSYEPFGLTYDSARDELWYNQKLVRWFEDYYPVDGGGEVGIDFFNEKGVVDIYAVRDLNNLTRHNDGSYEPGGKLTGLKEFSEEEFSARDIEAIKNPPVCEAIEGNPASVQEMKEIAAEYKAFGVTYNAAAGQWYYHGKKVRYFLDVLTSNGKKPDSGEFKGAIRNFYGDEGTVDIHTVRDFHTPDENGNGTLTAVEAYSRQEFDARTRENALYHEFSGDCTVSSAD